MSFRDSFSSALAWLRALITNLYFWGGMVFLLFLGAATYFLADAVLLPSYTRHDASTQIPNVEDLPFAEAKIQLQKHNLQVKRQIGRYNPNVDTGIVVAQTPLPTSTVKPGRRVYLTVNAGNVPTVQLPDLNGMSVREAKNRLSSLGLEVGNVQKDSIPSPYANTITKQDPTSGDSLQKGKEVELWYSTGLGDEEVEVPNIVGLRIREARRLLNQNKLRSVVVDTSASAENSDTTTVPLSKTDLERDSLLFVRHQARVPGTSVQAGTEVRLYTTEDAEKAARRRKVVMEEDSTAATPSTDN